MRATSGAIAFVCLVGLGLAGGVTLLSARHGPSPVPEIDPAALPVVQGELGVAPHAAPPVDLIPGVRSEVTRPPPVTASTSSASPSAR